MGGNGGVPRASCLTGALPPPSHAPCIGAGTRSQCGSVDEAGSGRAAGCGLTSLTRHGGSGLTRHGGSGLTSLTSMPSSPASALTSLTSTHPPTLTLTANDKIQGQTGVEGVGSGQAQEGCNGCSGGCSGGDMGGGDVMWSAGRSLCELPHEAVLCSSCGFFESESVRCDSCARWFCFGCTALSLQVPSPLLLSSSSLPPLLSLLFSPSSPLPPLLSLFSSPSSPLPLLLSLLSSLPLSPLPAFVETFKYSICKPTEAVSD